MRLPRFALAILLFAFVATSLSAQTWDDLQAGNARFRDTHQPLVFPRLPAIRTDLWRSGQQPRVTILVCSDSRVPPELLFDQTLGRLFVVRVAGNVADPLDIASIEYAIEHDYTRTLIVLGHEKCGAVETAMTKVIPESPNLRALVDRIRESFVVYHPKDLTEAAKGNAKFTVGYLREHSAIIDKAVTRTKNPVEFFAAYYDMQSGWVTKLP